MAKQRTVKMAAYLFAASAVALASIQVSMAKKPHPGVQAAAKPTARTADPHGSSTGRDHASERRTQNANPIDTSVTVLPRRPNGAKSEAPYGKQGFRVAPANTPQPHRLPTPMGAQPAPRNAIGVPVVPHQAAGTSHGPTLGMGVLPQPVPLSARGNFAQFGGGDIGAKPRTAPDVPGVGGGSFIRPLAPPSGIGGPARTIGGVNGTTFRRKD
jgi:hypothetical protein